VITEIFCAVSNPRMKISFTLWWKLDVTYDYCLYAWVKEPLCEYEFESADGSSHLLGSLQ